MGGFVELLPKQYFDGFMSTTMYTNVVDAGSAAGANLQGILDAASSGTFLMQPQHSNVNEDATFVDLGSNVQITGSATTNFGNYSQFGRYLRVKVVTSGGAAGYLRVLLVLKDSN